MTYLNKAKWIAFGLGLAMGVSLVTAADPPAAGGETATETVPWARKATKGLEETRVGGKLSDKGIIKTEAALFFIAPKTTGFTTREFPEVYWYISQPSKRVEFTLLKGNKTELVLILKNVQPGFHKLDLAREAKARGFKGLDLNNVDPGAAAASGAAPQITAAYRMVLTSADPELVAAAYVARVPAAAGQNPSDYSFQIRNELWFDAVDSLASRLSTDEVKRPAVRKQFSQLLEAEEVLRSTVGATASEENKRKARAEEDKVMQRLSVPDPIDLQSDRWDAETSDGGDPFSVPDPIDLQGKKATEKDGPKGGPDPKTK
jgi:hypothetical protein